MTNAILRGKPDAGNPHSCGMSNRRFGRAVLNVFFAFGVLCCAQTVLATDRSWVGGNGAWSDEAKWNPQGVPGTDPDDVANIPAAGTQTISVEANASLNRVAVDTVSAGAKQTLSIAPGKVLSADTMTVKATQPTDLTICGGGELCLTNAPFNVGDGALPVNLTVSGPGTVFRMPKPTGSGLYIGSTSGNAENLFRVTGCATAIVANATCLGRGWSPTVSCASRGRLLVDDGGYLDGGQLLFVGRGSDCVCGITNGTVVANALGTGTGERTVFTGSNAVVRAGDSISFPLLNSTGQHGHRFHFEDSRFEAGFFYANSQGNGNTGRLERCTLDVRNLYANALGSWNSSFTIADSSFVKLGTVDAGWNRSSNCVLRIVRSDLSVNTIKVGGSNVWDSAVLVEDGDVAAGSVVAGYNSTSEFTHNVRYEQDGGSLTASSEVNAGKHVSENAAIKLRGLSSFSTPKVICGDTAATRHARFVLADTLSNAAVERLWCGESASDAQILLTNSALSVTYASPPDGISATTVGRSTNASRNELLLVDSALTQTGGHLYVGNGSATSNNVLRLVRSTYDFRTTNGKGDVGVGNGSGAVSSRVEMVASTFKYDRKWIDLAHQAGAVGCSWEMRDGSRLEAPAAQFWVGYAGCDCRLALGGESTVEVQTLGMKNNAALVVSGAGNELKIGDPSMSAATGCAFLFRPSAEASEKPMLSVNRQLPFSSAAKLTVDLSEAGLGLHTLVKSDEALPDIAEGANVLLANPSSRRVYALRQSADKKTLYCQVDRKGMAVVIR